MDLESYLNQKATDYLKLIHIEYGKYFNQDQLKLFQQLLQSNIVVVEQNDDAYHAKNGKRMDQLAHGGRVFEDNKIHFYPFLLKDQSENNVRNMCEEVLIHELFHFFVRPNDMQVNDERFSVVNHDTTEALVDMCARDLQAKYNLYPNYNSNYANNVVFIREAFQNISNEDERMSLVFNGSVEDIFDKTTTNTYNSRNEYINTVNRTSEFNQKIKQMASSVSISLKKFNTIERHMLDVSANCKTKNEALNVINSMLKDNSFLSFVLNEQYDVTSLAKEYIDLANSYYQELSQGNMDIGSIIQEYNPNKGMYPLKTKLNQNQVIELATNFFGSINVEYANYFINDITNNKENIFFSDNPKATVRNDGLVHDVEVTNFGDLRDLYTVAHEYAHLFDSTNGVNETRNVITEANAQCMERCLDSYLMSLSDEQLSKYNMDKKILERDIIDRNVATFFTRLEHMKYIPNTQDLESRNKDSKYMISQIYSDNFEQLDYDSQKNAINNMIKETRNNNLLQVVSNIPCDLSKSKENPSREEAVTKSVETNVQKINKRMSIAKDNDSNQLTVDKPKVLSLKPNNQTNNSNSETSISSGYINTIILTLITGVAMGVVATLAYIFISK